VRFTARASHFAPAPGADGQPRYKDDSHEKDEGMEPSSVPPPPQAQPGRVQRRLARFRRICWICYAPPGFYTLRSFPARDGDLSVRGMMRGAHVFREGRVEYQLYELSVVL